MKPYSLALVAVLVSALGCVAGYQDSELSDHFVEEFAVELLERISSSGLLSSENYAKDSRDIVGLLPPLPDPLPLPDLDLGAINLTDSALHGLSTLTDVISIDEPVLTIKLDLGVPLLSANGSYEAFVPLDLGGTQLNLTGDGSFLLSFQNFSIDLSLRLNVNATTGTLSFNETSLNIGIEALAPGSAFEGMALNGNEMDWTDPETLSQFKDILLSYIGDAADSLSDTIETLLNTLLQKCTLHDLLAGDLSCTGLVPPPPTLPTTTAEPEEPTTAGVDRVAFELLTIMASFLLILWQ